MILDHSFAQIRSATQLSQLSQFLQSVFRSVSPSFANHVSQVSQIRVLQDFANTFFRSCTFVSRFLLKFFFLLQNPVLYVIHMESVLGRLHCG